MSFNSNIIPGAAPLQWSNVYDAFTKINENFDILVATVGDGSGLTPIDFGTLDTNVSPTSTNIYKLGDITHQWKAVHTAEWAETLGSETNGLWAGSAQIKGKGLIIDLPIGSTIDGDLIIDPDKTFFKSIQVNNDLSVEATEFGSVVNLLSGLGIDLSVNSGADSITIEVDPTFDLTGNVIADNGSILVNATTGYLTGNVGVAAEWRVTANSNTWKFRDDGVLEWPSLASFGDSGSSGDLLSAGAGNNLTLASEIDIVLISDSDGGSATWVFSSIGELTVPGPIISEFGGSPTVSLESSVTGGAIRGESGKTFKVSLSDGVSSFPEWVFGTDGELTAPGKIITPEIEGSLDGLAIYSNWAKDTGISIVSQTSLESVTLTSDRLVAISTNFGTSQRDWIFGATGNLDLPESSSVGNAVVQSTYNIQIKSNSNIWTFGTDGNLTLPASGYIIGNVTGFHTGDVKGSVFGDDSGKIIDAVENKVYGGIFATTLRTEESKISLGSGAGFINQGLSTVAIGSMAGNDTQGVASVAVGSSAGRVNQGVSAVAVGELAGLDTQGASAVAIGSMAGNDTQGSIAVAIGQNAGEVDQGSAGVAIGYYAGKTSQETGAVAIGYTTAQVTQRQGAVAIGWSAGQTNQGANAIAIGYRAGFTNQNAGSIILNASGVALEAAVSGFFVSPVRNQTGASGVVQYDSTTSEISFSSTLGSVSGTFTGNIFTNLIDSADSSAITVTPAVVFNTQVTVEGTLTVNDGIAGYISLAELKNVVAASTDFSDFQIRMAAL